jgi:hypothetical protein
LKTTTCLVCDRPLGLSGLTQTQTRSTPSLFSMGYKFFAQCTGVNTSNLKIPKRKMTSFKEETFSAPLSYATSIGIYARGSRPTTNSPFACTAMAWTLCAAPAPRCCSCHANGESCSLRSSPTIPAFLDAVPSRGAYLHTICAHWLEGDGCDKMLTRASASWADETGSDDPAELVPTTTLPPTPCWCMAILRKKTKCIVSSSAHNTATAILSIMNHGRIFKGTLFAMLLIFDNGTYLYWFSRST